MAPQAIDMGWHRSGLSDEYLKTLIHRGKRRHFGLLERPSLPPTKDNTVVDYKIFLCGRSGVGKTATITTLAGTDMPMTFCETAGIETTTIFWPALVRETGKVVYFRLNFWDVGDNAIKKFDHILPACRTNADCYLYTFSFTDRASFEDLPQLFSRMSIDQGNHMAPAQAVIGTRADKYVYSDISEREIDDFEETWKVPVLRIKNVKSDMPVMDKLKGISHTLNTLCNLLWTRDHLHMR